jgi:hypothetical protein
MHRYMEKERGYRTPFMLDIAQPLRLDTDFFQILVDNRLLCYTSYNHPRRNL